MAYERGGKIAAADINAFIASVNAVAGTGNGNKGYGLTDISTVTTGVNKARSSTWTDLRNAIDDSALHQGTSINVPPATLLELGDTIYAHETSAPTSDIYDFDSSIAAIDANYLNIDVIEQTVLTDFYTTPARATVWSGTITCTFDAVFASEDAARFYFNSGGQLRIDGDHPNSGAQPTQDDNWRYIFATAMGTVLLGRDATTRSGTSGTPAAIGFYDLTNTFQTIYDGTNIGSGSYSANDVIIEARVLNVVGTNGGNGDSVQIRVTLRDEHTGISGSYDQVASGTNMKISLRKSAIFLPDNPSFTQVISF